MNKEVRKVEEGIIQLLSVERRPLTTEYICSKLNISKSLASYVLYTLLKKGIVKRVYTEGYDPTRPFDTAAWVLKESTRRVKKDIDEIKIGYTKLVLSIPLPMLGLRSNLLNKYEALDLHDAYTHVIEMARQELKIMCPIIDAYALYPLITKILNFNSLNIKILTELSKSKDVIYLLKSFKSERIEIKDVAKVAKHGDYERKIFGIHAKLIIADDELALIGTFNLSKHHYLVNFDIGFLIYDTNVVKKLSSIFDELWDYVSTND